MPINTDANILDAVRTWLAWTGLTSFSGLLALYGAWIAFPPEIIVDGISDKSKKFNSESKLKIKNIGKLPALNIKIQIRKLTVKLDGLKINECNIINPPQSISRLASSEITEVTVTPGIHTAAGAHFTEFAYELEIHYSAKLIFMKRRICKRWNVVLRNIGDEFMWSVDII